MCGRHDKWKRTHSFFLVNFAQQVNDKFRWLKDGVRVRLRIHRRVEFAAYNDAGVV